MIKVAYFASGCFWGTEYYFGKSQGVVSTTVGYMGGEVPSPTYEQVSTGQTGHVETAKVEYDSDEISYEDLVKLFFETHDATQVGGQGPDIGSQYESKVFYNNDEEKAVIDKLIKTLENKGMKIVTKVEKASIFYPAENYHQDYYSKNGQTPYCHIYHKLF
jgi:peptide methionine sulfoxide reductase msrA/msrB